MLARQFEALRLAPSVTRFVKPPSSLFPQGKKNKRRERSAIPAATRDATSPSSSTATPPMTMPLTSSTSSTSTSSPPPPDLPPLPTTYRRLVARVPSPTFRDAALIEELALPLEPLSLGEGEVLVKIAVAGVNGGCETFRVRAEPGTPFEAAAAAGRASSAAEGAPGAPPASVPLGAEGAGTVVAVGPGVRPSLLAVGDKVTVSGGSAFAEFVVVGARACFKVPTTTAAPNQSSSRRSPLSPAEAVALSLSGLTAAVALKATAKIQRGETVLVTAAAGGTGHLAVQVAALAGCRVVAVAGGERKAERLRRELERLDPRGEMDHVVIDYKKSGKGAEDDLCGAISEALLQEEKNEDGKGGGSENEKNRTSGGASGVDVVYDGVGGDVRRAAFRNLARGARVLSVGYMSSYPHTKRYRGEGSIDDGDIVVVSAPNGGSEHCLGAAAAAAAAVALPPEPLLFWQRRSVSLPGDRTLFGDVWSGAAGDPRALARLRRELFAAALAGDVVPWIDDGDGDGDSDGDGDGDGGGPSSSPSSPRTPGPRFVGLESAADAVERLLSGESMGKVVLRVSGDDLGGSWW